MDPRIGVCGSFYSSNEDIRISNATETHLNATGGGQAPKISSRDSCMTPPPSCLISVFNQHFCQKIYQN